jgi:hypothetical protein
MWLCASAAATRASMRLYCHYHGGWQTVSCRAPDGFTCSLTIIDSRDYSQQAGVPTRVALSHLRKLAAIGYLTELPRRKYGLCNFRLHPVEADKIGQEIIAHLRGQGLPFIDEVYEAPPHRCAGVPP